MSDPRYDAGIVRGIRGSCAPGEWPASLLGLGAKVFGVFGACVDCKERVRNGRDPNRAIDGGYMSYGGVWLCKRDAQRRAETKAEAA